MTCTPLFAPRALLPGAFAVVLTLSAGPAQARQAGIVGESGKQLGGTCVECHAHSVTGDIRTSVVIEDAGSPAAMPLLHTKRYTLRVRATYAQAVGFSGLRFGFNTATGLSTRPRTQGVLQANLTETAARLEGGEATHTTPKVPTLRDVNNFPFVEWLVDWTPPALAMGADGNIKIFNSVRRPLGAAVSGPPAGEIRSLSPASNGPLGTLGAAGAECGATVNTLNPAVCGMAVTVTPTACVDADGDGWLPTACFSDRTNNGGDCNDNAAGINPGALDACNGLDDNCDGATDEGLTGTSFYPDADSDTHGADNVAAVMACNATRAMQLGVMNPVSNNTDCNDLEFLDKPGVSERCDGADNNCDGSTDEMLTTTAFYPDADTDNFGRSTAAAVQACNRAQAIAAGVANAVLNNMDCDDTRMNVRPGFNEVCDGLDNDCTGGADNGLATEVYYPDADMDGYGSTVAASARTACSAAQAAALGAPNATLDNTDCDDGLPRAHPTATETCDTMDEDCDGSTDEDFPYQNRAQGELCDSMDDPDLCRRGTVACSADGLSAICINDVASPEICDGQQQDDDCDGQPDQAVFANLGQVCGVAGTCTEGRYTCTSAGNGTHCVLINFPTEICANDADDDCDGMTDEVSDITYDGLPYNALCDSTQDADRCRNGLVKCVQNVPECLGDFATQEICGNSTDDDCDNETDEFPCTGEQPDAGELVDGGEPEDAGIPDAAAPPDAAGAADAAVPLVDAGVVTPVDAGAADAGEGSEVVCACASTGQTVPPGTAVLLMLGALLVRRRVTSR